MIKRYRPVPDDVPECDEPEPVVPVPELLLPDIPEPLLLEPLLVPEEFIPLEDDEPDSEPIRAPAGWASAPLGRPSAVAAC